MSDQLDLPFDDLLAASDKPALWTPRDIWVRLNQRVLEYFGEDRRFERKDVQKIHWPVLGLALRFSEGGSP